MPYSIKKCPKCKLEIMAKHHDEEICLNTKCNYRIKLTSPNECLLMTLADYRKLWQ